jgi:hypothetical protein
VALVPRHADQIRMERLTSPIYQIQSAVTASVLFRAATASRAAVRVAV